MQLERKLVMSMVALLLVTSPALATSQNAAIPFTAIDFTCAGGNIVVSDEPLISGTSVVVVTPIDQRKFLVQSTLSPTAFAGTWEAPGFGIALPFGFIVHHLGVGTGDLEGGTIQFKAVPSAAPPPDGCELVGVVAQLDGVINFPAGQVR